MKQLLYFIPIIGGVIYFQDSTPISDELEWAYGFGIPMYNFFIILFIACH